MSHRMSDILLSVNTNDPITSYVTLAISTLLIGVNLGKVNKDKMEL